MTPEQIQRSQTGHISHVFKRYMLPDINDASLSRQVMAEIQHKNAKQL